MDQPLWYSGSRTLGLNRQSVRLVVGIIITQTVFAAVERPPSGFGFGESRGKRQSEALDAVSVHEDMKHGTRVTNP